MKTNKTCTTCYKYTPKRGILKRLFSNIDSKQKQVYRLSKASV